MIDGAPLGLLGRHVRNGADQYPFLRSQQGRLQVGRGLRPAFRRALLRQPEIQDLHPPARADQYVRGLEVAMDDPFLVGRRQRIGQRNADAQKGFDRDPGRLNHSIERHPLHQLHGEKVDPLGVLDRVNRDDVRVTQRRYRARLPPEALEPVGIVGHLRGKHLERHVPPQRGVRRPVDFPHGPGAQTLDDSVVRESLGNQARLLRPARYPHYSERKPRRGPF